MTIALVLSHRGHSVADIFQDFGVGFLFGGLIFIIIGIVAGALAKKKAAAAKE